MDASSLSLAGHQRPSPTIVPSFLLGTYCDLLQEAFRLSPWIGDLAWGPSSPWSVQRAALGGLELRA